VPTVTTFFNFAVDAAGNRTNLSPVAAANLRIETSQGSRFTYDRAWLTDANALPISQTLLLREVPYDGKGSGATRFQSAQEDFDTWKGLDQCSNTPLVASHNGVCQTYTQCAAGTEVELCSPRGDHLFFFADAAGNPDNLLVPDTAWEFFSRHSL
jgi:hypothetical protein